MLDFYHDLGVIVKHRDTVVLQFQWLIKVFKELVTIPSFDKQVRKNMEAHNYHQTALSL